MHEKTPVGKIVVIDLPARTALEASTDSSYFKSDNGLFRKLFRYISSNDVSMTTPVEADIFPGKMRFFVGYEDSKKKVTVRRLCIGKKAPCPESRLHRYQGKLLRKKFYIQ